MASHDLSLDLRVNTGSRLLTVAVSGCTAVGLNENIDYCLLVSSEMYGHILSLMAFEKSCLFRRNKKLAGAFSFELTLIFYKIEI